MVVADIAVLSGRGKTGGAVVSALRRLGESPHEFDVVKLSHHGSRRNTSRELAAMVRSPHWIVSTNGAQFGHPDPECLARVIQTQDRPTFHVNYATPQVPADKVPFLPDLIAYAGRDYTVELPDGDEGISVVL